MKDRKIVKILLHFTAKEHKSFLRFVQSPYFNTSQILVDLLEYLYKFAPTFSKNKLTVQNAFKHLYPQKKFDEQIINRHLSNLFKLVEEYIIISRSKEDQIKRNIYLLEYYKEIQNFNYFESWTKKLRTQNNSYQYRDYEFFHHQYLIEYQSAAIQAAEDTRDQEINFDRTEIAFDIQYWIRKLSLLCNQLNRKNFIGDNSINRLKVDDVIQFLSSSDLLEVPAVEVLFTTLILLNEPNDKSNYNALKLTLAKHHKNFKPEDIQNISTFLINCALRLFSKGQETYEECFDLFEFQIEHGYIYLNGYIHPHILKNVVTVALRLKKFSWAETFLKDNKDNIESQVSYYWNLANLHYTKGEYEIAQDILIVNRYDDIFYQLGTKRMLTKIYYHLDYSDLLFSFVNTFRVFVSRKELNPLQKRRHQNFINFTLKLVKSLPGDQNLDQLLKKIESTDQVADKSWLLEQTKARMESQF